MEVRTEEQLTAVVYEPPALVELGEFSEDTLGPIVGPLVDTFVFFPRP